MISQYFTRDRRFSLEDGAQPRLIDAQTESMSLCKLRDICLSIFLMSWPDGLQLILVSCVVRRYSQRLHCAMCSMSIFASVIKPAATCACRGRGLIW
jgi:hypothetical protein